MLNVYLLLQLGNNGECNDDNDDYGHDRHINGDENDDDGNKQKASPVV